MTNESSSIPATVDFTLWRGDTFRRALTVTDDSDQDWNFTDAEVRLYVRNNQEDSALITLETGSGINITDNIVTIELTDAQTNELQARSYLYEIEYTSSGGDVTTWIVGKLTLRDKPA